MTSPSTDEPRPAPAGVEEEDDYRCVNGHDLCHGGASAGPECPYCERISPAPAGVEEAIPAGYALVPIEPTKEMVRAGNAYTHCGGPCGNRAAHDVWKVMLAASPAKTEG